MIRLIACLACIMFAASNCDAGWRARAVRRATVVVPPVVVPVAPVVAVPRVCVPGQPCYLVPMYAPPVRRLPVIVVP